MKKLFFLLVVALPCLIFTACGDDDDDLTPSNGSTLGEGVINGHTWVDLGLSVKWADRNVGASSPEKYGDYFAWGETQPKSVYNWSTYKWCNGSYDSITKYCYDSSYGYNGLIDNKTTLDPADDAATANWGLGWRTPTRDEIEELIAKCTWTWTIQNGVHGRKITGPNGKSIFLPAAGYRYNSDLCGAGPSGYYWSSSPCSVSPMSMFSLNFFSDTVGWGSCGFRYYGRSVRPVCL